MRFWDRIRDYVFLALLLITSLVVLISVNQDALYTLRSVSLNFTSRVESSFAWVGRYFTALEENDDLRSNNIRLSSELARLRELEIENNRLRKLLSFRDSSDFAILSARIVSKDITKTKNFLTLDVGEREGVSVGMPVIDDQGLLGKVILVGSRYSLVQPYLNTDFKVAAKIQPNQIWGIVEWQGNQTDLLIMRHVNKTEEVNVGDLVVTAGDGYSESYPNGIPIGTVARTETLPGENTQLVYLTPSTPLERAEHAFVLVSRPNPEQSETESQRAEFD